MVVVSSLLMRSWLSPPRTTGRCFKERTRPQPSYTRGSGGKSRLRLRSSASFEFACERNRTERPKWSGGKQDRAHGDCGICGVTSQRGKEIRCRLEKARCGKSQSGYGNEDDGRDQRYHESVFYGGRTRFLGSSPCSRCQLLLHDGLTLRGCPYPISIRYLRESRNGSGDSFSVLIRGLRLHALPWPADGANCERWRGAASLHPSIRSSR